MSVRSVSVLAAALAVASCGGGDAPREAASDTGAAPAAQAAPAMEMRSLSLLPGMRAHLDSLAAASAGEAVALLAAHDQMMSRMLDAMGGDMAMMSMRADYAWTALADSVRRDLADLPALSGGPFRARLHVHVKRVRRLLALHEGMTRRR